MTLRLPTPEPAALLGHLPRWGAEPLALLEEGAELARTQGTGLFRLWLGREAVVGFSPAWNKRLLTDLPTFQSRGSFSEWVPYLAGGIILTDAPQHAPRRKALNPGFDRPNVAALVDAMRDACPTVPREPFDALAWADHAVLRMLNAAYFSGEFNERLLHTFLAPLRQDFPAPMLPRPIVKKQFETELQRLTKKREEMPRADLLGFLLEMEDAFSPSPLAGEGRRAAAGRGVNDEALTETRISLAAAHDTTTHALAYALWFAARFPQWHAPEHHPALLKEVLRLYPPGWMGSRRLAKEVEWNGVHLPAGTLTLYSPYLSGRDPERWENANEFRPERWQHSPPAWAYLPFGGAERTCLGMHLAQALILTVLADLPPLRARWGRPQAHPGLTLGPRGPLWIQRMGDSTDV